MAGGPARPAESSAGWKTSFSQVLPTIRPPACACSAAASARPSRRSGNHLQQLAVVVDPSLVAQLLDRRLRADPLNELTPREREVPGLMAEGLTDRGIAQRLSVPPKTIEMQVRHIFEKLSLPERALESKRVRAVLTHLRGVALPPGFP
jgi:DNA-binding NarL/FixJ family response regulator